MSAILIQPKDNSEFQLLTTLLSKMKVSAKILADEEWEDLGLGLLIKEVDQSDTVSRESVFAKLREI
jgi:hypothetical protein